MFWNLKCWMFSLRDDDNWQLQLPGHFIIHKKAVSFFFISNMIQARSSRMNFPYHISESLETMGIRIRDLESLWPWIRNGKILIRNKHSGSATLIFSTTKMHLLSEKVQIQDWKNDAGSGSNRHNRFQIPKPVLWNRNVTIYYGSGSGSDF